MLERKEKRKEMKSKEKRKRGKEVGMNRCVGKEGIEKGNEK
jgi:hypothetical protein